MISADSVASNADLAGELGSQDALDNLQRDPTVDPNPATQARQLALADVLSTLRGRTPPLFEGELSNPMELNSVVVYGALARLYRNNITTGDDQDVSANKYRIYQKLYESHLAALRPSLFSQQTAGPATIQFSRR